MGTITSTGTPGTNNYHVTATSGGGYLPGYGPPGSGLKQVGNASVPGSSAVGGASPYYAFPGAGPNTSASTSNTVQTAGPNGPFAGSGGAVSSSLNNNNNAGQNLLNTWSNGTGAAYTQAQNQQQQQDAQAAAASGLGSSPWGASQQTNAMTNFNTQWTNSLLARQEGALAAAEGATAPLTSEYNQSFGSSTSGNSTTPGQQQPGGGGSGGGTGAAPQPAGALPYPTMSTNGGGPAMLSPQPSVPGQPQNPGPLYGGTTGQGYTGSTGMMTDAGTGYNQIVNPTPQQNGGGQGAMDQATGGAGSQYPLNGPTYPAVTDPTGFSDQMNQIDQSPVIANDPNSWAAITAPEQVQYVLSDTTEWPDPTISY